MDQNDKSSKTELTESQKDQLGNEADNLSYILRDESHEVADRIASEWTKLKMETVLKDFYTYDQLYDTIMDGYQCAQTYKMSYVESPYSGDIEANVEYARQAMHHQMLLDRAPFLSHLLYTQHPKAGFVHDDDEEHKHVGRERAIEMANRFRHVPGMITVFYIDRGWSRGMVDALHYCKKHVLPFEIASIHDQDVKDARRELQYDDQLAIQKFN